MKYDKHHVDKIIIALSNGEGRVNACKEANIDYQTFLNWLNDPNKIEFLEAVKKAEDNGNDKIKDICKLRVIKDKSWQSAAWWLERRYKLEFGKSTDITTKGESLNDLSRLSTEELVERAEAINKINESSN